jgi:hypothetical protein
MRRHARAEIESCVIEMIARSRRAVGAALLETADLRIAEIPATRTLGEVAAERCQMPDLRRGLIAASAASAVIRSFAATAAIGSPT